MHDNIILSANELIVCPQCAREFKLIECISPRPVDRNANEFEAQRKANMQVVDQIAKLQEQVSSARRAERLAQTTIEQLRKEAREIAGGVRTENQTATLPLLRLKSCRMRLKDVRKNGA